MLSFYSSLSLVLRPSFPCREKDMTMMMKMITCLRGQWISRLRECFTTKSNTYNVSVVSVYSSECWMLWWDSLLCFINSFLAGLLHEIHCQLTLLALSFLRDYILHMYKTKKEHKFPQQTWRHYCTMFEIKKNIEYLLSLINLPFVITVNCCSGNTKD